MKIKTMVLTAIAGLFITYANAGVLTSVEMDRSTQAIDVSDVSYIGQWRSLSVQMLYSTANPTAQSIKCGLNPFVQSTVTNWRALQGRASTMTLTIPFGQNARFDVSIPTITINGKEIFYRVHWSSGVTSSNSILSLLTAVTNYANGEYTATASSNILTIWAASSGSYANSWYATSSSGTAISVGSATTSNWNAYFSNGNNNGHISISDLSLLEGTSFFALKTASDTAKSISNAISSHTLYNGIVVSSHSGSVVYTTAVANGVDQIRFSASNGLTITQVSTVSQTPNISIDADIITIVNHPFRTGLPVFLTTQTPNVAPTGLFTTVTYYVVISTVDQNAFRLATSKVIASTGGYVNIPSIAVNNSTITITPVPFAITGDSGLKWQGSNDGFTWADLSVSSVTSTNLKSSGSTLWDFDDPAYKYLRSVFAAPTTGGNNLKSIFYGRGE